jgi:hypothetical protein
MLEGSSRSADRALAPAVRTGDVEGRKEHFVAGAEHRSGGAAVVPGCHHHNRNLNNTDFFTEDDMNNIYIIYRV